MTGPNPTRDGSAQILLTGATGFLGKVVLYELLRRADELDIGRVYVVARGRRGTPAEARIRSRVFPLPFFAALPPGRLDRVSVVTGDLCEPDLGIARPTWRDLLGSLTHVIHCAASVDFDLPIAEAAAINTTGALQMLELARRCARLESFVSVSTAYVTPHRGDRLPIAEALAPLPCAPERLYDEILAGRYDAPSDQSALLARTGLPNTYTLTKSLAEHLLVGRASGVPLAIVRPSIITASVERPIRGWIDSAAAFAALVMMVATGRMRAIIGRPSARLDLVPVDFVADRILDAAFGDSARASARIAHAVAGPAHSPTVADCARHVERWFQGHAAGDAGRLARVRYIGPDGWRFRLWHHFEHRRRPESRPIERRLAEATRRFSYFTSHTFAFESSPATGHAGFDASRHVETTCAGIDRHLLGGTRS